MHAAYLHLLAVNHQTSVDLEEGQGFVKDLQAWALPDHCFSWKGLLEEERGGV